MSAAAVQVPIGVEDEFKGVVDLVHWRSIYNEGDKGYAIPLSDWPFVSDTTTLQVERCGERGDP